MPEAIDSRLAFGRSDGDEKIQSMGLSSWGQFVMGVGYASRSFVHYVAVRNLCNRR